MEIRFCLSSALLLSENSRLHPYAVVSAQKLVEELWSLTKRCRDQNGVVPCFRGSLKFGSTNTDVTQLSSGIWDSTQTHLRQGGRGGAAVAVCSQQAKWKGVNTSPAAVRLFKCLCTVTLHCNIQVMGSWLQLVFLEVVFWVHAVITVCNVLIVCF